MSEVSRDYRIDYRREEQNKKKSHFLLPPPAILEAYEAMSPGSTDKLLAMAKEEQHHRHEWEDKALEAYVLTNRLGMLFGSIVAVSIIVASVYLALNVDIKTAIVLASCGFLSLTVSSLVTLRVRKFERKPRKLREPFEIVKI
jgi:uncharacterized membrane protein